MATPTEEQAREWYGPMLALALHLTHGDRQAAEDVTQDAFVKALVWDPPTISRGGMCLLVKSAHFTRWRHEHRHPWGMPRSLEGWTPGRGAQDVEREVCDRETLAEVAALPGGDLLLADAAGWPQPLFAARRGMTCAALKMRLHRLRHGPLARISPW
jgi:hypothetical protein